MSRDRALIHVSLAYFVTLVVAAVSVDALARLGYDSLIVHFGVADLLATLVLFAFSVRWNNSSLYDAYWSVIPMWIAAHLAYLGWDSGANHLRALLVVALVGYWGVRLTHNWARGWAGMDHEDWRYVGMRKSTGSLYWLVSLTGIHLFPTALVFLGCLPLFAVMTTATAPLGWLDGLAALVCAGAVTLELVADNQLRDYVLHRKKPGETMTEGVWGWSRHPNYFGEMMFWWGLYLFGVAAVGLDPWWMILGGVAMSSLFNFISIPLIERRMAARRSDYAQVRARVSRLVPWFPRR